MDFAGNDAIPFVHLSWRKKAWWNIRIQGNSARSQNLKASASLLIITPRPWELLDQGANKEAPPAAGG